MPRARTRSRSVRQLVRAQVDIWFDLFQRHNLLTFATAIAMKALVALVALTLLLVGVLGMIGREDVWTAHIGPAIAPRVLPEVYSGFNATVEKIFSSSSGGIVAFAAVLTIWEVSGAVRACMSAFSRIEDTRDDRPWWIRFPVAIGIAVVLTACVLGAFLLVAAAGNLTHGAWHYAFAILRWAGAIVAITFGFGVLVRFAP